MVSSAGLGEERSGFAKQAWREPTDVPCPDLAMVLDGCTVRSNVVATVALQPDLVIASVPVKHRRLVDYLYRLRCGHNDQSV